MGRRSYLRLLALLGAILVIELQVQAASIKDELPALILDEGSGSQPAPLASSSSSAPTEAAKSAVAAAADDQATKPIGETTEAAASGDKESKLTIPYETKVEEVKSSPDGSGSSSSESNKGQSAITTTTATAANQTTSQQTTTEPAPSAAKPAEAPAPPPSQNEKDISVLLANKDDAENDLASPTATAAADTKLTIVVTVPQSADEKKEAPIDLDSPVDTKSQGSSGVAAGSGIANDDRFQYSLGGSGASDSAATAKTPIAVDQEPSSKAPVEGVNSPTASGESPLEDKKKKEGEEDASSRPVESVAAAAKEVAASKPAEASAAPSTISGQPSQESELKTILELEILRRPDAKKVETADDKTKSIAAEPVSNTEGAQQSPSKEVAVASPPSPTQAPADEQTMVTIRIMLKSKPEPEAAVSPTSSSPTSSVVTTGEPASTSSLAPASSSQEPGELVTKTEPTTKDNKPQIEEPMKPKSEANVTAAATTTTPAPTQPITTTTTTSKPVAKASPERPIQNVPSILAVALGTALGAAINPLGPVQPKEKPIVGLSKPINGTAIATAAAAAAATTTPKPALGASTTTPTTRRWTPSSSTTAPSRRRPILPSIRRRFRPYNRFSPFPWGGADSYIPGADSYIPGAEPEFGMPADPMAAPSSKSPPQATSHKPRRRGHSTTESPVKSSSTSSTTTTSAPSETGDYGGDEEVPTTSTRRRAGGNKRRHHQSHGIDSEQPSTSRRRNHHHNHHHHHHSRPNPAEREDRPFGAGGESPASSSFPGFEPSSFGSRPPTPGFGLFNTGSTGSGFDLLNPFSSWLDEIGGKPPQRQQPPMRGPTSPFGGGSPSRPLGHRPIPVEGDYNDEGSPSYAGSAHHDHHDHGYGNHGDHHGGGGGRQNGRPIDDHHHHRDCQDDYDHHHDVHHQRVPYRPHREREPTRPRPPPPIGPGAGDYDTYPPSSSSSYGRRPVAGRPYDRSGEPSVGSSASSSGGSSAETSPSLYGRGERAGDSSLASPPRRVPSIFSPFESLFGALDDELFSLRSSFIETPLAASSSAVAKADSAGTFDALVTSPKISMPQPLSSASEQAVAAKESDDDRMAGPAVRETQPQQHSAVGGGSNINGKSEPRTIIGWQRVGGEQLATGAGGQQASPCSSPREGGLMCFFSMQRHQLPLFDLFRRL